MKKFIVSIIAISVILSLAGCGNKGGQATTEPYAPTTVPAAETSSENPEETTKTAEASTEPQTENFNVLFETAKDKAESGENENNPESYENVKFYLPEGSDKITEGNSGVYAYKHEDENYTLYFIIDFDKGQATDFVEGNGDNFGDRGKITGGTLNDVVIVSYKEKSMEWYYGLCFKYKNSYNTVVLSDEYGTRLELNPTDLNEALKIMNEKSVTDYF